MKRILLATALALAFVTATVTSTRAHEGHEHDERSRAPVSLWYIVGVVGNKAFPYASAEGIIGFKDEDACKEHLAGPVFAVAMDQLRALVAQHEGPAVAAKVYAECRLDGRPA